MTYSYCGRRPCHTHFINSLSVACLLSSSFFHFYSLIGCCVNYRIPAFKHLSAEVLGEIADALDEVSLQYLLIF